MLNASSIAIASLLATVIAGCAVSTEPSSAEPGTEATSAAAWPPAPLAIPRTGESASERCAAPITPLTGNWACGSSGVRTGEKSVTASADYADNCAGVATVDFAVPNCGDPAGATQYDEIYVSAIPTTLSPNNCAASYLDYTIWTFSAGSWTLGESGEAHGTFAEGTCDLRAPAYRPLASAASEIRIAASAFQPVARPLPGRKTVTVGATPLDVSFDMSFTE